MSNVPWHMMTLRWRGRGPMAAAISAAVLILWLTSFLLAASIMASTRWGERFEPFGGGFGNRIGIPQRGIAPVVDLGDDAADPFLERDLRLPAEIAANPADVREGAVRLARALGDVDDRPAQELDQAVDRLRIAGADVP